MNYMGKVAEMLGVEIGEEFKIEFDNGMLSIDNYILLDKGMFCSDGDLVSAPCIWHLIKGEYKIIKLPWKPKFGDKYYTYYTNDGEWLIWDITWVGDVSDYARLKSGIVFRTSQEALNALPQKYKELTGKEYE